MFILTKKPYSVKGTLSMLPEEEDVNSYNVQHDILCQSLVNHRLPLVIQTDVKQVGLGVI
jgi:hypothetical protein